MKTSHLAASAILALGSLALTNCSSPQMAGQAGTQLSASGPSILNEQVYPKTIELNTRLQPVTPAQVTADVKDFRSNVTNVRLRFLHVPLEVPMENIGGTTWRATLSSKELSNLAVSGQTISYDANIIAQSADGKTAESPKPVTISIKAPDISKATG